MSIAYRNMYSIFGHKTLMKQISFRCLSNNSKISEKVRLFGGIREPEFRYLTESISPYVSEFLGGKIESIEKGAVSMKLPFRKEFVGNPMLPCLHGGVTASIIDHVGGFCAWSSLTDSTKVVNTIDLKVNYLRPAPCEDLICDAVVDDTSESGKLIRCNISVYNKDKSVKVASGHGLYNVYSSGVDLAKLMHPTSVDDD